MNFLDIGSGLCRYPLYRLRSLTLGADGMAGQSEHNWFCSEQQRQEAVNRLLLLPQTGLRAAILRGASGMGRTRVLQQVRSESAQLGIISLLVNLQELACGDVLQYCCKSLSRSGSGLSGRSCREELLQEFQLQLRAMAACGKRTLLLLDDLQLQNSGADDLLQMLITISNDQLNSLTLVCATTDAVPDALTETVFMPVEIGAMTAAASSAFLLEHLANCGVSEDYLEPADIELLVTAAAGVPRSLMQIGELLQVHAAVWSNESPSTTEVLEILEHLSLASSQNNDPGDQLPRRSA